MHGEVYIRASEKDGWLEFSFSWIPFCFRVSLDMLSVQSSPDTPWDEKNDKAFWRGRDSRRERLNLVKLARQFPDLINASLTNFFFFRDEEATYGPKEDHISFFKFFDVSPLYSHANNLRCCKLIILDINLQYKYQLNIDGTVAAYRFPYLLAGGSVVLKQVEIYYINLFVHFMRHQICFTNNIHSILLVQDSPYYEHFYSDLKPDVHYIPIKADLSDLIEKIQWAKTHDAEVKQIGLNGRRYATHHLLPKDIVCYHAVLLKVFCFSLFCKKNKVIILRIY